MLEKNFHETRDPDLVLSDERVQQIIYYPTPELDGRCITTANQSDPVSIDLLGQNCNTPLGVGPLLKAVGISVDYRSIWDRRSVAFDFPHPDTYSSRLQAIHNAYPDFAPPEFTAFDGGRYTSQYLLSCLAQRQTPLATRDYAVVHDYEVHAPVWTVMSPELFEAICTQSETLTPSETPTWIQRTDTLTHLGGFGNMLASTVDKNLREPMTDALERYGFSAVDAIRLAYQSENYRHEVIMPVVNRLLQ